MVSMVANHLWQSTLFAVVVGLLTEIFRNNGAHIRHGLWLAASLKFLLPFSLLTVLGSQFAWHAASVSATAASAPQQWSALMERITQPMAGSASSAITAAVPVRNSMDFVSVLFAVWICGIAVVLCVWLLRWLRINAILRTAQPFPGHLPTDQPIAVRSSSTMMEPGIVGIFRPVLLMPHGIDARLGSEQLQAIVAHELCHVRRQDNLTGAIHMIVEAIFWFYPLVWWIGARMVEERENACDEAVVESGNDPAVYAEGLLNVCEFYVASRLVCAAGVSGADLKKRIEAIMRDRVMDKLHPGKKALLTTVAFAAIAGPIVIGLFQTPAARAQAPAAASRTPTFASASIKLGSPDTLQKTLLMNPMTGQFTLRNISLKTLIGFAYDLQDNEIVGPADLLSQRYSIDAQAAAAPSANHAKDEYQSMVRSLLEDRFKLAFHWDTKRVPVYALVGGANARIKEADAGDPGPFLQRGMNSVSGHAVPLELLLKFLSSQLDRPILDQTGLARTYNFKLKWGPEPGEPNAPANSSDPPAIPSSAVLIEAVQQQLGMGLLPQDGAVKRMAIDRVVQPSDLVAPPQEVSIDAKVFDRYVGHYSFLGSMIMTVTRDGDRFLTQLTGQSQVPIFAKSEREFFAKVVDAEFTLVTNARGEATELVLHQNGRHFTAPRMTEAAAQAQADALARRVREQKPAPGSEAALRRHIEALQHDQPNYDDMVPAAAAEVRPQWPVVKEQFAHVGQLQSITFKAVGPAGADIYEARFEKRTFAWRIGLSPEGKVGLLNFQQLPGS
jgi:bla regulator protein blaR1